MYIVIDAETKDPLLKTYGSGWCFKYHYPEVEFSVLGKGLVTETGFNVYLDLIKDNGALGVLDSELNKHTTWIFHNALYDLGCLKYLYRDSLNLDNITIIDTMLLMKLYRQDLFSYGLDNCCKELKITEGKQSNMLHDYAWNSGLYSQYKKEKTGRNTHKRPTDNLLEDFCKTNMDLLPVDIVGNYCIQDCKATEKVYLKLISHFQDEHGQKVIKRISDILKICLKMKLRGVYIDLDKCIELSFKWIKQSNDLRVIITEKLGEPAINIDSVRQLAQRLLDMGYPILRTDKGNLSLTGDWLEEQTDDLCKLIKTYRKALYAEKNYIQKIIQYQGAIPEKYKTNKSIGRLFPSFKPLGATSTGRFTSGGGQGCLELNVLAISGHDEEFGVPVREVFIANPGNKLICADYSAQEPRLMVHYAKILGLPGVEDIIQEWENNPAMKYHKKIQEKTQLPYDVAKTVTLGLAYDMHAYGLSINLGIEYKEAEKLMEQYFLMVPYLRPLMKTCSNNLKQLGYIRTIGGRKLYIDKPYFHEGKLRTQERKGMSKLIQGSAADQTMEAMIACDKAGLQLVLCVHDELLVECVEADGYKDSMELKDYMENTIKLEAPCYAEVGVGDNWLQAKPS